MGNFHSEIGKFVTLRPLAVEDAEVTFRWRQSDRANLLNKGAETVEQQATWISSRPSSERNFMIQLNSDGSPVGMLSLVKIDLQNRNAESARFLIGEEEKVKGVPVAVEAMKLLYELAFEKLELERIYGTVAEENKMMIKWQKYLGMKEEGRLRRHYFINGKFQDAICLGILAEEFRKEAAGKMKALIAMGSK